MNEVIKIKEDIRKLEGKLEQLKEALVLVQLHCDHEFISSSYSKQCIKCHINESLNW